MNSGVFTPGIVDGLTVALDRDAQFVQATVSPGRALDDSGRLLVLADDAQVVLDSVTIGQTYSLIIKYRESNEDGGAAGDKATRTVERPSVDLVARPLVAGEVLLASLSVVNGEVAIDPVWGTRRARRHSGAVLGSIEFPLEPASLEQRLLPPEPTPISIVARGFAEGNSPVLEVMAPHILLCGECAFVRVGSEAGGRDPHRQ